ncbi:DUF6924 domain-containing protein [Streptomyces griseosporeus]|uniref:DUF6924 domain-containing protein n=1 Tax=Streptomyces griseosporeus TaxID=1910 RepID=UPI00167D3F34|nr:hypothetical protein [Streptomyces griseosporeus]GHF77534.1 hypothetical protein GCM10018783_54640 [Streptomyces griseosporeus]
MALPQPADLTTLVLRTDFRDDAAWEALRAALDAAGGLSCATCVSDPRFAGASIAALLAEDAAAEDEAVCEVFLADATTLADPEHRLLAVDLYTEPGRTVRIPARWYADMSINLGIANMDFAEFADAADPSGTFRGFGDAD